MPKTKKKDQEPKEFVVRVEATIVGSVTVHAMDEDEAKEAAHGSIPVPPNFSLTDWDVGKPKEVV